MDEIASTDLEHLTDIGRIVMEMLLTNITTKEPDSDPKEGRLRFHITYSLYVMHHEKNETIQRFLFRDFAC